MPDNAIITLLFLLCIAVASGGMASAFLEPMLPVVQSMLSSCAWGIWPGLWRGFEVSTALAIVMVLLVHCASRLQRLPPDGILKTAALIGAIALPYIVVIPLSCVVGCIMTQS